MLISWYFTRDGKTRLGPFSLAQMQHLALIGQLQPSLMVRPGETARWAAARTFPELFATLTAPASTPSGVQPRSFWARVGSGGVGVLRAVWAVPAATCQEAWRLASQFRLRRRLRRLRREQKQLLVDLGVRLLAAGVAFPAREALARRFRGLSQAQELNRQAAQAGDREKRKEASRLEAELRSLYADFGRQALAANVPFEGRAEQEARRQLSEADLARTQEQIDARQKQARPHKRWLALLGAAAAAALVLLSVGLAWRNWPSGPEPPPAGPEPPRAGPDDPGPRRTMQEWFVRLAPAVPLIEAVEGGSGSGFLLKRGGKYLVVTNRHVVEDAHKGVAVHFLLGDGGGDEKRFSVPAGKTKVVWVHHSADLAVIDVSAAGPEIDGLKIEPVRLAPPGHRARVGEHVFAIGHPGAGGAGLLLRTMSDGIVSAVGRKQDDTTFLQVTAALNPGNSGGPLFDDEGRVIGVNTFIIRKDRGLPLEALNFALEAEFLHELLDDPARKSLDAEAVAAVLNLDEAEPPAALAREMGEKVRPLVRAGFQLQRGSRKVFHLGAGKERWIAVPCEGTSFCAAAAVNQGADALYLAVYDGEGKAIALDSDGDPDPLVPFRTAKAGTYWLWIKNASDKNAHVVVTLWKRGG